MTARTQADLQNLLLTITSHVYFQTPESIKIEYPCIVYERSKINTRWANNKPYELNTAYQLVVVDKDPESLIIDEVAKLPYCEHVRHYTADNLNHDVFTLYY